MTDEQPYLHIARQLDERGRRILEAWHARVRADASLATTTEWTRRQFYDHFPDVLKDFGRILRCWPRQAPAAQESQFKHAHAHAKTRWLQGYSLRNLIREWSHFNTVVLDALNDVRSSGADVDQQVFRSVELMWAELTGEHLSESAAEYQRLQQAEAATRSEELAAMLVQLQNAAHRRVRSLSSAIAGLRTDLSTVMTTNALFKSAATDEERAELQVMSQDSVSALDRSLSDMVLLARLEAGQEVREIRAFDVGEALVVLLAGLQPQAEQSRCHITWSGPEDYHVEGDARRVPQLVEQLVLTGILSDRRGPIDVEWSDDAREERRWTFAVRQHVPHTAHPSSPPISRAIAEATGHAQQAAGVPPTGFEAKLIDGLIPVASRDGVNLLIAKHLCELLDASIELEAAEGVATFRVSLPKSYS